MNFKDILDEWEKETARPYGKKRLKDDERKAASVNPSSRICEPGDTDDIEKTGRGAARRERDQPVANPMDIWLRRYGIQDKDSCSTERAESPAERRRRLRALKPEAVIDLHGLTRDEAWARLDSFFADCVRRRLQKILIVHGKGTHSEDVPVLGQTVRRFLEQNPRAGESGHPAANEGGAGSTWVLLK